jgi:hypothetical protein
MGRLPYGDGLWRLEYCADSGVLAGSGGAIRSLVRWAAFAPPDGWWKGAVMNVFAYKVALYCEPCGDKIRTDLDNRGETPADIDLEHTYDSDSYPKGPYEAGEADCPHHCEQCGAFLENALTVDGYAYATDAVVEACRAGRWDAEALTTWAPFYDITLPPHVGAGTGLITLVNPLAADNLFVLCFGAYGWTRLAVWAHHLDDALDEAIDWLVDNAPGHIVDDQVEEALTVGLASRCGRTTWTKHEWGIVAENPTPAEWQAIVRGT